MPSNAYEAVARANSRHCNLIHLQTASRCCHSAGGTLAVAGVPLPLPRCRQRAGMRGVLGTRHEVRKIAPLACEEVR